MGPALLPGQSNATVVSPIQEKARQALASTIQALGGERWTNLQTVRTQGQTAAFFQGKSTGVILDVTITTKLPTPESPEKQLVDLGGNGHVLHIFSGNQAWEITYKGKKDLPEDEIENHLRWRGHSLGVVLRRRYANPATMLFDTGQLLVERRMVDRITLIDPSNDSVTLDVDAENHLPLRLSFEWRDPRFHDKNLDVVKYDNYQYVDGIATPFTTTWLRNGAIVRQRFLRSVEYDIVFSNDFFNLDRAAGRLK